MLKVRRRDAPPQGVPIPEERTAATAKKVAGAVGPALARFDEFRRLSMEQVTRRFVGPGTMPG